MMVGGIFGGADTEMGDTPPLASSAATPTHRPSQTHYQETQASIDEWIDRLRISNPLTQDLATVNMLTTALNLTKDQLTTAITEALYEGDEDKDTDISRFQQVQERFPENFEQFLETNDEEEGFKDELRTAVQNNVNQRAQSDPGLGEWVKENETLKILEVVFLRLS